MNVKTNEVFKTAKNAFGHFVHIHFCTFFREASLFSVFHLPFALALCYFYSVINQLKLSVINNACYKKFYKLI
jgi:hypothetical protein